MEPDSILDPITTSRWPHLSSLVSLTSFKFITLLLPLLYQLSSTPLSLTASPPQLLSTPVKLQHLHRGFIQHSGLLGSTHLLFLAPPQLPIHGHTKTSSSSTMASIWDLQKAPLTNAHLLSHCDTHSSSSPTSQISSPLALPLFCVTSILATHSFKPIFHVPYCHYHLLQTTPPILFP